MDTEETQLVDEHEDVDRLTMIFEAQGLSPEKAAEKAANRISELEDELSDSIV